jgi:hypothetical protein
VLAQRLQGIDDHPANHCRSGHSVITNAKRHLRNRWILAQDIARCFPSVTPARVLRALRRFGLADPLLQPVTSLCTVSGELPQGAPTSPALLSGVLRPLDDALSNEAKRQGLVYTRYVDDLFVSGNREFPRFERFLVRTVTKAGFRLAEGKRRQWGPHRRATLAGVMLGTTLSPTPEYERSVSRLVNQVVRGEVALDASELRQLQGQIAWIRAISPAKGVRLLVRLHKAVRGDEYW